MAATLPLKVMKFGKRTGSASLVDLLLTSGGDERIVIDPETSRNRYGTPAAPAPDEMWFSSSTASTISPAGYLAVRSGA